MNIVRIIAENYDVPVLRKNVRKLPCLDDFKFFGRIENNPCLNCVVSIVVAGVSENHWSRTKSTENIEDGYK
jgi:hypothetical protein